MLQALLAASLAFAVLAGMVWRALANARAGALEIARLQRRERAMLEIVRRLLDASRESSDEVLSVLVRSLEHVEPRADTVMIFLPVENDLLCRVASGERARHFAQLRLPRDAASALPALAAQSGHREAGPHGMLLPTDRRALAVPMRDSGGMRGVVYLASVAEAAFDDETIVHAIELAASPYALALERERDRADATYDGLTGLLTPRAFRNRLREAIARTRLGVERVLTLWFIDTDRFKLVNDTCGHAAGDAVLQTVAALLHAHTVPGVDVIGRNGGDEFCALVDETQKSVAIDRAQAFCEAVRRHDFGLPIAVTASIGVASFPFDARDANELLEVADAAMYHSKRTGRDRVSFAVNGMSFAIFREGSTASAAANAT
jgi:diguanylate cyclase (GGDEF)-like protein